MPILASNQNAGEWPTFLDVKKAIQAAGVLLRFEQTRRMSRLRLLKLLYIADRRSIKETGFPIIGSKLVAMKDGPLHNEVYDLIKGNHIREPEWAAHFQNFGGRDVGMRDEPGVDELSDYDVAMLGKVSEDHATMTDWDVAELTHTFDEWNKNYPDKTVSTSTTIPLADVLDGLKLQDKKQSILSENRDHEELARLFAAD